MIVNTGLITLLNSQVTYLNGLTWGLFTNNFTIAAGTVLANLTAGAWAGYAAVSGLTWSVPTIIAGKAVNSASPNPTFGNSSGSTVTFYGWYCYDGASQLVAAVNIGATTLANGANYVLTPTLSDATA
jgi:hypothetical protein